MYHYIFCLYEKSKVSFKVCQSSFQIIGISETIIVAARFGALKLTNCCITKHSSYGASLPKIGFHNTTIHTLNCEKEAPYPYSRQVERKVETYQCLISSVESPWTNHGRTNENSFCHHSTLTTAKLFMRIQNSKCLNSYYRIVDKMALY